MCMRNVFTQDVNVPTPYDNGYDTVDEFGTRLTRQESGDGAGRVQGSYGYADAQGIWRDVKYVADEGGFRASVSTNEPGTANQNPADVEVSAQEPPAGVQPVVVPAPKAIVPAVRNVAAVPVVKKVAAPAYYGGYYGAGVGAPYYGARVGAALYGAGVGAPYYGAGVGAPYYGARVGASLYGARVGAPYYGGRVVGAPYYGGRVVGAPYYSSGSIWPAAGRYGLPAHRIVKVLH
ncbi:cuticle protein 16.8-like [Limulus polyphemus]|uniref:Cuticle protein 16.8-like n=1 Tax=Limulus polyphemus TaxID=6850 RepID=A0ABM1BZF9_LIMPO|nr:cuticle protein 16.8-like [Limulus polyphemus]